MSVESIEAAAVPLIGDVVKALTPEAESLLKSAEARIVAEAEHLKSEIDSSHNGIITWLRAEFAKASAAVPDPTPAAPASPTH
jgi:hypothetical protein